MNVVQYHFTTIFLTKFSFYVNDTILMWLKMILINYSNPKNPLNIKKKSDLQISKLFIPKCFSDF